MADAKGKQAEQHGREDRMGSPGDGRYRGSATEQGETTHGPDAACTSFFHIS
ncbi:hypothetical protein GCM10010172_53920 [Paractinoplanes ferrugineus]|uniref:Uncharacterized protein n=1 Tax=Paractinoplanes ferrugineus TaxID=113564 RepID=A0A919MGM8_9ACTN|nr:hypothetical protein Afe05nite_36300 [Actinoplanes ferrugineus]